MLSNPPFGTEWKKIDKALRDGYAGRGHNGRFGPDLPRVSDGSLLFLLHLVSKMRPAAQGGSQVKTVPLSEDVASYFKREVLPQAPDAWSGHEKTKTGYEIPFNRHSYVFEPPRELAEIDAELKTVTTRIMKVLGELSEGRQVMPWASRAGL